MQIPSLLAHAIIPELHSQSCDYLYQSHYFSAQIQANRPISRIFRGYKILLNAKPKFEFANRVLVYLCTSSAMSNITRLLKYLLQALTAFFLFCMYFLNRSVDIKTLYTGADKHSYITRVCSVSTEWVSEALSDAQHTALSRDSRQQKEE